MSDVTGLVAPLGKSTPTPSPAGPLQLAPALAPDAPCRQITNWLSSSPSLSTWFQVLTVRRGLSPLQNP